jgi:hypothetical protein
MLNVNNENSGRSFYFTQNISERNITGTAKIWLFYQTYSGGLGFIHLIFTQNTENHAINLFWQKGVFQDVDLRPAELRSAPDSIKLCNRQLGDDYTYYMSPNTNVTRICDWATANLNPWTLCNKVCQWLSTGQWFFLGTPVSSSNKTDRHDITEILLKVALNTLTLYYCDI